MHTFLDFTFLRTLPIAQVRNGFAELIKISSCSHLEVFNLLDKYCEQLIESKFGRADGAPDELRHAADTVRQRPKTLVGPACTKINRSIAKAFMKCSDWKRQISTSLG